MTENEYTHIGFLDYEYYIAVDNTKASHCHGQRISSTNSSQKQYYYSHNITCTIIVLQIDSFPSVDSHCKPNCWQRRAVPFK